MLDIILFASGIIMGSTGGILLKLGAKNVPFDKGVLPLMYSILTNWSLLISFVLYFMPVVIWIYLLKRYPISLLQPILALTYLVTPLLSIIFLKETVSLQRWLGIAIIVVGVLVISKS